MEHRWLELPYCSNNLFQHNSSLHTAPFYRFGFKQMSLEQFLHVQFTCLDKRTRRELYRTVRTREVSRVEVW